MGYLSVGLNVDPLDWTAADARSIVARTVSQVESGDAERSTQIVLLHDSGGDRSATIAALPEIIRQLRAKGYEFATVSQLAGLNDGVAMPALAGARDVAAKASQHLFSGVSGGWRLVGLLFVIAITLGIARSLNGIDVENNRATLKKAGFLSRDARVKERKKAGLKKARKAPQYWMR